MPKNPAAEGCGLRNQFREPIDIPPILTKNQKVRIYQPRFLAMEVRGEYVAMAVRPI